MSLPHAIAADNQADFGAFFENADSQTSFIACKQAIYERDWYLYDRDLLQKGGLNTQQAEASYLAMRESQMRMIYFGKLAQGMDDDAYSARERQVDAVMLAMFERDKPAAVREYKRIGEYCLNQVYPALISRSTALAELDRAIRSIPMPEELEKAAKAEFIEHATKGTAK